MTFRRVLVLAITASAGCAEDVPTLHTTTTALVNTSLAPPDDHVPMEFGHYRWDLVEAPPGKSVRDLSSETGAAVTITPPGRGIYVFDRWFVGEAAEQLSYHVVVTVEGALPTALVVGSTMVAVGAAATLDGSTSSSPEGLMLSFQWRLALRPATSTADVSNAMNPTLMFAPDVAGSYGIELRVFDGELWSMPAVTTLVAR